jgi:S1-C subfamily serine protease
VLSNAHVIEDAAAIKVVGEGRSMAAELVFADPRNDLALLRAEQPLPPPSASVRGSTFIWARRWLRWASPCRGCSDQGPQASAGNIAGLCGIGNDSSLFQFTAPIASGNSGGPILDPSGHMVGLVSSSLNLERVRASGNNAENINFGIKGAIVRSFLDAFGLSPELASSHSPIGRAAMVREARSSLYRIVCTC